MMDMFMDTSICGLSYHQIHRIKCPTNNQKHAYNVPNMESFEPMVTNVCSGQEMLYKINQRGIIQKWNNGE